jgi:Rieske Fe-S protein
MDRKEFLSTLGLSGSLLFTSDCNFSCIHKTPLPSSNIDIKIDLDSTTYSKLKTPGNFIFIADKTDIIVAQTIHQQFIATNARCTHEGSLVAYYQSDILFCSKHGATFSTDGSNITGPAVKPLISYKTKLSGNILHIYS